MTLVTMALLSSLAIADPPAHKLADAAWLAGTWRSPATEKTHVEEIWSTPAHGSMMGMFRLSPPGKASLYEFELIEESAEGVFLRLKHFRPGLEDVDKAPLKLKLVEASERRLVFENPDNAKPRRIVYARQAEQLNVTVVTLRDGKEVSFTLKLERAK